MNVISADVKGQAITANLKALQALLAFAAEQSTEACLASEGGEQNRAIGTVIGLDACLDRAKVLYEATLVLHRLKAD